MALRYKVVYTNDARADISEIFDGISQVAWLGSAAKWTNRIINKADSLELFPERGARYWLDDRYRTLRVGKYVIIYSVDKARRSVMVIRVVYARRDLPMIKMGAVV